MAKFCTKCGKKLEEGQVCDCSKNKTKKEEVRKSTSGFDFNAYLNSYVDIIKGVFTKPVDTIKKHATADNFILGLICILINCIVSGVFLYCFLGKAISSISSMMGYGSLLMGSSSLEVPFIKTFFYGIIFMAVGFATTGVMIYLIANPILKDKVDIKKIFSLIGVCSVFTTLTTAVSIIINYISIKFMFVVLIIAGIFYLTHLYQGINEITKVDKNKLAYVFVPAVSVATFVVVYILPKIMF